MTISMELINMLDEFLNGGMNAEDFSFDFPARLAYVFDELEKENAALANLLGDELPLLCGDYEPDEETRKEHPRWYISEQQMREKVLEVYSKAKQYI